MQIGILFFLLFSLMSCQKSQLLTTADFEHAQDQQQMIINGKFVNSAESIASHVAMISTINHEGVSEICTAVFVSKDQILTAKHCIAQDLGAMSVTFRSSSYDDDMNVTDLPILDVHYFNGEGRNDLALIKIKVTPDMHHRPVEISALNNFKNIDVQLVGYGVASIDGYDSQILRKKFVAASVIQSAQNTFMLEQSSGGICFGDSGGPVLYYDSVLKQYFLVGIASGVIQGGAANPCLNQSIFMNVLFYKKQIQELL